MERERKALTDAKIHYITINILDALDGLSVFEGIGILETVKYSLLSNKIKG